jgi:hypothetical protein
MYGHAFLQIEVHSKKSRRLFSQTRNLQDKIRHGRSRSTGLLVVTAGEANRGTFGLRAQMATVGLKIQFERKLYLALIILAVAR